MICKTCGIYFGIDRLQTRSRFEHINLTIPAMYTLFYKSTPNIISDLLGMDVETIQDIISCRLHVIICFDLKDYKSEQVIPTETYKNMWIRNDQCSVASGEQVIMELLSRIQLIEIKIFFNKENKTNEI